MRLLLIAGLLLAGTAGPALAQEAAVGQRVDRLEKEMRAVQRKVFPGGSQQFLEAQIGAQPAPQVEAGAPASSPVADLTARVSSLEQELSRLTGQTEQNSFKIRQIEEQFARFKSDADSRLNAVEGAPTAGGGLGAVTPPRLSPPSPATPVSPSTTPFAGDPIPAPATASNSVDPGEDAYLAGYRLWEQKKFGEAETALKAMVAKYPKHRRASYAQNLLGRAYLDDGQPAKAAEALYANYQKMPRGERAPDSLYYLGQSLMALKPPKTADACKVYAELVDVYGEKIAQPLKDRIAKGRVDAKCGA